MTDIVVSYPRKVIARTVRKIAFGGPRYYRQRARVFGAGVGASYALATSGHTSDASGAGTSSGWARVRKHTYVLRRQNMPLSDYPRLLVPDPELRWATPGASSRAMSVPSENRLMEV